MYPSPDSEAALEAATMQFFQSALGYKICDATHEFDTGKSMLGRHDTGEVVLKGILQVALVGLNPDLPKVALEAALQQLTAPRHLLSLAAANQEVYTLLREGVKVNFRNAQNVMVTETVRVINWQQPHLNYFLAVQQLTITGETYHRRPDVVLFVNGLPLVVVELKAHTVTLREAYQNNIRTYKTDIPQLFWYNAFIILSNGSSSLVGSLTAGFDHFATWKRISDEKEQGIIALDTLLEGTCDPARLLDMVENFILFDASQGEVRKLVGKNHQYLGVNAALRAVEQIGQNQGKLGVFWHTQGSGKSYSMVFFTRKVRRTLPGNRTFVIITDREDLDDQIYKNFSNTGTLLEAQDQIRAKSSSHLRQLLQEDHTYIFTLIQKFQTQDGSPYPLLSERDDIIVITDEAHRSQYDIFASNMRRALPHAAFIGFTGTPLMVGEEKTRAVFGDYVSTYNFAQSIEDGATVPLWYESRVPHLKLENPLLNTQIEQLLEAAELDGEQERRLEQEFSQEYHLITRQDRLETVAADIVQNYRVQGVEGLDYHSKAMVISIDKKTTVRLYDAVQRHWQQAIEEVRANLPTLTDPDELAYATRQLAFMEGTDMAVVVSPSQNEVADFRAMGLDMHRHRQRMVKEDLATAFKTPEHPLRVVFVCAMWITGFDAPSCSTIYLDKPMQNHTLMQTIARANRVFRTKPNGLIVDYIGVFRSLQQALGIYAQGSSNDLMPTQDKAVLIDYLQNLIDETIAFCQGLGIQWARVQAAQGFERIRLMDETVEALVINDATKQKFLDYVRGVRRTYKSILPDARVLPFTPFSKFLGVIAEKIYALNPYVDVSDLQSQMEGLLDQSVKAGTYTPAPSHQRLDLSQIDFEALALQFKPRFKHTQAEQLKNAISAKLKRMVLLNQSRMDYQDQFQKMIAAWNSNSPSIEVQFAELVAFAKSLTAEEQRTLTENLTEEELAIFDLITRPAREWTKADQQQLKAMIQELLSKLKAEKLVLDWRKDAKKQDGVRDLILEKLDQALPAWVDRPLFEAKCEVVYQHIFDSYYGAGRSIYSDVA